MASNSDKEKYINRTASVMANNTEAISLREILEDQKYRYIKSPTKLYRYCRFDHNGYSIDAIRNQYLYLTPTDMLDDQFEIAVNVAKYDSSERIEKAKRVLQERILEKIAKQNPKSRNQISKIKNEIGNDLLNEKALNLIKEKAGQAGLETEFNQISSIFADPDFIGKNEDLLKYLTTLDQKLGLCALTEEKANQVMWVMYGDNYRGMMIEYYIAPDNYLIKSSLLPVIYKNKRNCDPLELYIDIMMNYLLTGNQKQTKESLYKWLFKVISTKNKEWEFQNEWRVVGLAAQKIKSPPIKSIYLGREADQENIEKIQALSREHGFRLYRQTENFETMKIEYVDF